MFVLFIIFLLVPLSQWITNSKVSGKYLDENSKYQILEQSTPLELLY